MTDEKIGKCERCGKKAKVRYYVLEDYTRSKDKAKDGGWVNDRMLCGVCAEKVDDFMRGEII